MPNASIDRVYSLVVLGAMARRAMPSDHRLLSRSFAMWFAIAVLCFLLWMVAVGLFNVTGNSVHLLALLGMVSLALHVAPRRRKAV